MNKERKEAFIATYGGRPIQRYMDIAFNVAAKTEDEIGKDLCDFKIQEIVKMYKELRNTCTSSTIYQRNMMFGWYTEWCINNGYSLLLKNNYSNVTMKDINNLAESGQIYTELQIKKFAHRAEQNPVDAFLVSIPFYGVSNKNGYEELESIKLDSFDEKKGTLTLPNRTITLPNWLIAYGVASCTTYRYVSSSPSGGNVSFDLQGDGVVKFRASANTKTHNVRYAVSNKYSRIFKGLANDESYSYTKVRTSGIAYRLQLLSVQYGTRDVAELLRTPEGIKEIIERFDINHGSAEHIDPTITFRYKGYLMDKQFVRSEN